MTGQPLPRLVPSLALLLIFQVQLAGAETILPTQTIEMNRSSLPGAASAAAVVQGQSLQLAQAGTLGAALDRQPGISATSYGPWASRPILRGLDGDRVRIVQNGTTLLDASALSPDHAVPVDTASLSRLELLRGPAALAYGSSIAGGVLHLQDQQIPRPLPSGQVAKPHGYLQAGWNAASQGQQLAGQIAGRSLAWAWQAQGYWRQSDDLRIPDFAHSSAYRQQFPDAPGNSTRRSLPNSDGQASGGSVGASTALNRGWLGMSLSRHDSDYGVVADPAVRIGMQRSQASVAASYPLQDLTDGLLGNTRLALSYTDYAHQERHAGQIDTRFSHQGTTGRLEARHRTLGIGRYALDGQIGLQFSDSRFGTTGEEAIVPTVRNRQISFFMVERMQPRDDLDVSGAIRLERHQLTPLSALHREHDAEHDLPHDMPHKLPNGRHDAHDMAASPLPSRQFSTASAALGVSYAINTQSRLLANLGYSERAPTLYELYADGPHVATGQYLTGNPRLQPEKGWNLEVGLARRAVQSQLRASLFYNRFQHYIAEIRTGDLHIHQHAGDPAMSMLAEAAYQALPADFFGAELSGQWQLMPVALAGWSGHLGMDVRADAVRATNRQTGEPLPRIPPLRLTTGFNWSQYPLLAAKYAAGWQIRLELEQAARQQRVGAGELPVSAYNALNFQANIPLRITPSGRTQLVFRGQNLTDTDIRHATSALRDIAPATGRHAQLMIRTIF